MFKGCISALVTPFQNGQVEYTKLRELVEFQISEGIQGFVPVGSTGEAATLTDKERYQIIKTVVDTCKKRVPVIAGAGTSSTAKTIENITSAREAGADGVLVVSPYYVKPTQEGIFRHFEAITRNTDLPVIIYNIPARTNVNILPETFKRLAELKGIVSVKECSGSFDQLSQIQLACKLDILSGEDSLTVPILSLGAKGVISASANVIPKDMTRMCAFALDGNFAEARKLHMKYTPLFNVLFIESNPIPMKSALKIMGLVSGELRLPLCPMSPSNEEKLKSVMAQCGLKTTTR